jgi:hypothetical protein
MPLCTKDLFLRRTEYLPCLASLCRNELLKQGGEIDSIDRGTAPVQENYRSCALTKDALQVLFPPYQVGCFAWGPREVSIPYASLSEVIDRNGPLGSLLQRSHAIERPKTPGPTLFANEDPWFLYAS